MMYVIYRNLHRLKYLSLFSALALVIFFLYASDSLVSKLSEEERTKAEVWAEAVRSLASDDVANSVELASKVITSNKTIPVLIADEEDRVISYNNIDSTLVDTSGVYLKAQLDRLKKGGRMIEIPLGKHRQYLYYDESSLLRALSLFPYVQLLIIFLFLSIVYWAFSSAKKAEQRQVWVGLTKETAHQLGTPISSMLALCELLEDQKVDASILREMNKDVSRLQTIAERFSKIGSKPVLEPVVLSDVIASSMDYMRERSSSNVQFQLNLSPSDTEAENKVMISRPLFEWVIENLTKNAIDAMDGQGVISVTVLPMARRVAIDFGDTGKGIAARYHQSVFAPGFTTKKRGWGLGLTLVKRIIEEFFGGKIYVKQSEEGHGTVFRILLPTLSLANNK